MNHLIVINGGLYPATADLSAISLVEAAQLERLRTMIGVYSKRSTGLGYSMVVAPYLNRFLRAVADGIFQSLNTGIVSFWSTLDGLTDTESMLRAINLFKATAVDCELVAMVLSKPQAHRMPAFASKEIFGFELDRVAQSLMAQTAFGDGFVVHRTLKSGTLLVP
jgi:hypothetical protein